MVIAPSAVPFGCFVKTVTLCHVRFTADNGVDACFFCCLVKSDSGKHIAVFCDANGIHTQIGNCI